MWNPQDYTTHADRIADAFMSGLGMGGTPLIDLVEKTARDNALNPDQIRRLGSITNRAVFARKYARDKGQPDRRVDFELVDNEDVIGRIQGASKTAGVAARPASYPDLPDPRAPHLAKLAAEIPSPLHAPSKPSAAKRYATVAKIASELPIELRILDESWCGDVSELAASFGKTGAQAHRDFELNALGVLGAGVLVELNAVRDKLAMPLIADDPAKVAEAQAWVYGVADEQTERLKRAMATREEYGQAHAMKAHVDQEKADLLKEFCGG